MAASARFKRAISKQLASLIPCSEPELNNLLRIPSQRTECQFSLSLERLRAKHPNVATEISPTTWAAQLADNFRPDTSIEGATAVGTQLQFRVRQTEFTKQVLSQVYQEHDSYGWAHAKHKGTVVIDYSSPNIAKPFHAGHLRSTILGNFAKRIHEAMGYRVIGINYLGDWGKQYGLLAVGFERYGDQTLLEKNPIHHLYDVYVKINQEAKSDPNIHVLANAYFKRMEQGDHTSLAQWRTLKDMSIASYASIYDRLGIRFDAYSGESEVSEYIPKVYELLRARNLLTRTDDGAYAVDLREHNLGLPVIQRADGTSLYITRDLASIIMRKERYGFDKAIYAVGVEQNAYFQQVFKIAEMMYDNINLEHLSFGRINGISTRRGTAIFLEDILDAAKDKITQYMRSDEGRAAVEEQDMDKIADTLGISAILVQDMKSKRTKNYSFSWDRMTDARGDTGVFLQYAHARACGIERKADTPITVECDFSFLEEREAFELVQTISYFPDLVDSSFASLEPCTLVNYLFKLSHATSLASHRLRVKGTELELAKARMLLFWAARKTLSNGLTLLGIRPLERM
ncbi:Arginyl-tRNA synthetase [Apophysomyces ossiformis]|uniref:arginine--tRNA ligase n=1 Tax=Apophysomyces ossiformis TaxID=679940 RepID=A0A8H7BKG4_9FUNG|nr:Arginyl-tRNA synthetase [Apophysomyces ossiformis]